MVGRFCLVAACVAGTATWASPPPPLSPPAGWEAHVLPGFEPSLESVLARTAGRLTDDAAREAWKNWGPEAVEGFFTLLDDPLWEKFRDPILRMLFLSPHPAARTRLEQRLRMVASGDNAPKTGSERFLLTRYYPIYFPDTALSLFKELAKSPREDVRVAAGIALARLATDESLAAAREVAAGLSGDRRTSVEYSIEAVMGKKRAKEIMIK